MIEPYSNSKKYGELLIDPKHFGELVTYTHERGKPGHCILEHHGNRPTPDPVQLLAGSVQYLPPVKPYAAACRTIAGQETHDGQKTLGFA